MQKEKLKNIKVFVLRKRIIIPAVFIILIVLFTFSSSSSKDTISVIPVTMGDLRQTVQATGQVTSNTDVALSFNKSGIVKSVKVAVGDKVKKGQILASLDQATEIAGVTQARGALKAAQARLAHTKEGSTNEEIALAQVTLDQTKQTQDTLVKNAYQSLLNTTPEALPENGINDYIAPTISGTYSLGKEGTIKIQVYASGGNSGYSFIVSGLTSGVGSVTNTTPQPIGTSGLYIKFPVNFNSSTSDWIITIPNKKASTYLANYNAYQQALTQSQLAVEQLQAELALKQASARKSDVDLAEADVVSAEGGLQAAEALYENTIIRAPADGTITTVGSKYGELADVKKEALVLQDIDNLYIEADINESNIATVALGQSVAITFDAFGKDKKFTGTVVHIDPASVTTDGVVNYKVKVSLNEKDIAIRPGMNAEIVITALTKHAVISVPKATVTVKDGISSVNVITNEKKKSYESRTVRTGILGDGNSLEIIDGLSVGESVALIATN